MTNIAKGLMVRTWYVLRNRKIYGLVWLEPKIGSEEGLGVEKDIRLDWYVDSILHDLIVLRRLY
jgi:hypothetical protein